MKTVFLLIILTLCFSNCKSSKIAKPKKRTSSKTATKKENKKDSHIIAYKKSKANDIIKFAKQFKGVRYKYGGTTKKGMDCSGLIYTSFKSENINLPRTTKDLSVTGDWVDLKAVKKGDLLFFATKKNSRKVNHVGIVTSSKVGRVEFIHSTSSKGVITSLLSERYWYFAFVQARRVF